MAVANCSVVMLRSSMIPNSLPAARSTVRRASSSPALVLTLSVDIVEDVQDADNRALRFSFGPPVMLRRDHLQDDEVSLSNDLSFQPLQFRLAHLAAALGQRKLVVLLDWVDIVVRLALDGQGVLHFGGLN